MRIRVVDLETTGLEPDAEVIELGWCDVVLEPATASWGVGQVRSRLFRPAFGIPPEASAVHHLTDADIPPDAPVGTPTALGAFLFAGPHPDMLAAHNCAFEQQWLSRVDRGLPWICTWKCALRLHPLAPGHGNQVLRYLFDLGLDPVKASPPHRAGPDAYVTAHLLMRLLDDVGMTSITGSRTGWLVAWSAQPAAMARVPFGKHSGALWADVPHDYLVWMVRNCRDSQPDAVWNAEQELRRRLDRDRPATDENVRRAF